LWRHFKGGWQTATLPENAIKLPQNHCARKLDEIVAKAT
jgi:hypothetical protein